MNARERLDDYLRALRERLRLAIFTRAGAAIAIAIVAILGAAVYYLQLRGFPFGGVVASRAILVFAIAALAVGLLWWPLRKLRRNAGATQLESTLPDQHGRIQTYLEQRNAPKASVLIDLLAEDALKVAQQSPIERVVAPRRIWIAASLGGVALLALVLMLTAGKSLWVYGSRYVLLGQEIPREAVPVREVLLKPGDATLRRNADLNVRAEVKGFKPQKVELFVRFADTERWEQAPMQSTAEDRYGFTLYALRAPLTYYVRADGVQSKEHTIHVVDVPRIDKMELAYSYPEWTNLPPRIDTDQRDISAVPDTKVALKIQASAPLEEPIIVIDKDSAEMRAQQASAAGEIVVRKPARYHIAARVAGEWVALTDEYEISIVEDQPPTIEIVKPGRDARASAIEEVPVAVQAKDDFKVQNVELRYAVNGGEWRRVKLPAQSTEVHAKTLLQLEELGDKQPLVPGDLITYYAVTGDRQQSAQTDLFMVQVQPFDRRFTEGQSGGGGGGEGDSEQQQIAERQRDLLVATWNLERAKEQKRRTPEQIKESADMLSGLQDKLAEQTNTLIERTRARVNVETDPRLKNFIESLQSAVKAMGPAATNLKAIELQKAIPSEQTALQMLQRAEASFRDIQVARSQGQQNSGAARASRDIAELYELEMDLSKNKYETEKELSQETPEQSVDEAIEKLRELARRQQQLAEQRQQQQQPTQAERWKQEQLRREAEELRRRLQELANQQLAQQQSQQGQQGSQSSSQSGAIGQSGQSQGQSQQSEEQRRTQEALRSVESALQAMRNAENQNGNPRAAEEASRRLQQAADRMQPQQGRPSPADAVQQLADEAAKVAEAQRKSEIDLRLALAQVDQADNQMRMRRDGLNQNQARRLAEQKNQLLRDLQALEDKMRNSAQAQRRAAPDTAKRLSEIVDELSSANPQSRLSQTIVELERGRADQSAMSESLVTEALQNAAHDLRNAARLAQQEGERQANGAQPDQLLTEVAQLRRALDEAQRRAAQTGGDRQSGERREGQQQANAQRQGQQGQQAQQAQQGQPGQQGREGQEGGERTAQSGQSGQAQGGERGGDRDGMNIGSGGRDGFNRDFGGPIAGPRPFGGPEHQIGDGERARIANAVRERINAVQQRIAAGTLTRADLEALRAVIPQVRRLSGDVLAQQAELIRSIERLELAALAAAEKKRTQIAARTGAPAQGGAQDSEAVAEYYRRLGRK